jgi:hypothetical protein
MSSRSLTSFLPGRDVIQAGQDPIEFTIKSFIANINLRDWTQKVCEDSSWVCPVSLKFDKGKAYDTGVNISCQESSQRSKLRIPVEGDTSKILKHFQFLVVSVNTDSNFDMTSSRPTHTFPAYMYRDSFKHEWKICICDPNYSGLGVDLDIDQKLLRIGMFILERLASQKIDPIVNLHRGVNLNFLLRSGVCSAAACVNLKATEILSYFSGEKSQNGRLLMVSILTAAAKIRQNAKLFAGEYYRMSLRNGRQSSQDRMRLIFKESRFSRSPSPFKHSHQLQTEITSPREFDRSHMMDVDSSDEERADIFPKIYKIT